MTDLQTNQAKALEEVLIKGDLSSLSSEQKVLYYNKVCESLNLNPLTRPFEYTTLNGRLTLYARKECTDQMRNRDNISITISSREVIGDIYVVTAKAKNKEGREEESTGCVAIVHLKGDALANAYMKCETKAKRRVTLSICGLGMLDETEVESIPHEAPKESPVELETEDDHYKKTMLKLINTKRLEIGITKEELKAFCKKTFNKEEPFSLTKDELKATHLWVTTFTREENEEFRTASYLRLSQEKNEFCPAPWTTEKEKKEDLI